MRKRTFYFDGSDGASEMLVLILNHYADIAFPKGGSDCAAASREAMLRIVATLQQAKEVELSRRQRPILSSAVKWFYTDSEYANPNDPLFMSLLTRLSLK